MMTLNDCAYGVSPSGGGLVCSTVSAIITLVKEPDVPLLVVYQSSSRRTASRLRAPRRGVNR
jgi:hypothetical protein